LRELLQILFYEAPAFFRTPFLRTGQQPCIPPHKGVYWGKKEVFAMWFVYALGSAVFAALTSILAKIGIEGVNSTLATAIRTAVVLRQAEP